MTNNVRRKITQYYHQITTQLASYSFTKHLRIKLSINQNVFASFPALAKRKTRTKIDIS